MTPETLRLEFAKLPPIPTNVPLHTWPWHQHRIRQQVAEEDPLKMLEWSTIAATMHTGNGAEFTQAQKETIPARYLRATTDPRFGGVPPTANLIHQAYHLWQWADKTGQQVEDLSHIVEFGGGYGAMALLCKRLGFKGQYTIIDLPEFSLLQQFYLSNTIGIDGIDFVSSFFGRTDLFIALYSITEIPLMDRAEIMDEIDFSSCLIAHQTEYRLPSGKVINNPEWSKVLVLAKQDGYKWHRWRNELMERHWYVVGERNGGL